MQKASVQNHNANNRHNALADLAQGRLGYVCGNKQIDAQRRRNKANSQVDNHDDAEMYGSTPMACTTGRKTGAKMMMAAFVSIKQPTNKHNRLISSRMPMRLPVINAACGQM